MKYIFFVVLIFSSYLTYAQYSVGGGVSTFNSTNTGFTRVGINIFYEEPDNEVQSFYLRGLFTLPHNSTDTVSLTNLQTFNSVLRERTRTSNFIAVGGGNRRYLYNTYESLFAIYGSIHLKGVFSNFKEEIEDYDPSIYQANEQLFDNSIALLIGLGANIGFVYQLPYRGTLKFDTALDVFQQLYDPGSILGNEIGGVGLTFNFAYRHDIF